MPTLEEEKEAFGTWLHNRSKTNQKRNQTRRELKELRTAYPKAHWKKGLFCPVCGHKRVLSLEVSSFLSSLGTGAHLCRVCDTLFYYGKKEVMP